MHFCQLNFKKEQESRFDVIKFLQNNRKTHPIPQTQGDQQSVFGQSKVSFIFAL